MSKKKQAARKSTISGHGKFIVARQQCLEKGIVMKINEGYALCSTAGARIGLVLLAGVGFAGSARANTVHVCATCAHTSIQSAVNDAANGDSIQIDAGRYIENVTIQGKSLKLTGVSAASTIVAAAARGPVFTLGSATPGATPFLITLEGLTITGGSHLSGTGVGGGVQVRAGSFLNIIDSTIAENRAISGGGIGVDSPGSPTTQITHCLIQHNDTATPRPSGGGGGVEVRAGSTVQIRDTTFTGNKARDGGGIYSWPESSVTVIASSFNANSAIAQPTPVGGIGGGGGAIAATGALDVDTSYFVSNTANSEAGGGAINLSYQSDTIVTISNSIIAQNFAPLGGGINAVGGTLLLNRAYVVQNGTYGLFFGNGVNYLPSESTVKDNSTGDICTPVSCP
jgi:hypothetical protein